MKSDLVDRTRRFAVGNIKFVESLSKSKTTDIIGKQLIRAATSVGANYRAACRARSRADFISKITLVEEEADEVAYWLELLQELGIGDEAKRAVLKQEANELTAIFVSSSKTAKQNR